MEKSAAQTNTPQSARSGSSTDDKSIQKQSTINHRRVFFVAAFEMTWQMAIVVIVPIVGGYKLDQAANTAPALTIIGFIVAMVGIFFVMKHAVTQANQRLTPKEPRQ